MHYYIIDNKIYGYNTPFNPEFYNYEKLSDAQAVFYKTNPRATLDEVRAMQLAPLPEPTLEEFKEQRIINCSNLSFEKRKEVCPDYKNDNAVLGLYSPETKARIVECNTAFRAEYYRVKALINACASAQELEMIECGFDSLVQEYSDLHNI